MKNIKCFLFEDYLKKNNDPIISEQMLLKRLNNLFEQYNKSNLNFDLPPANENLLKINDLLEQLQIQTTRFSPEEHRKLAEEKINLLNQEQKTLFWEIVEAIENSKVFKG